MDDVAVEADAGHEEEVALIRPPQVEARALAVEEEAQGGRGFARHPDLLGEDVAHASPDDAERGRRVDEAVSDLVYRAVPAAGEDYVGAGERGLAGKGDAVAGGLSVEEIDLPALLAQEAGGRDQPSAVGRVVSAGVVDDGGALQRPKYTFAGRRPLTDVLYFEH
jgi:hypothetical protein